MKKEIVLIIMIATSFSGYSQFSRDLISFNYTLAPIGNDDGIELYKTSLKLNVPIKLKKGVLINSIGYDYYQLNYSNTNFDTSTLNNFYGLNYSAMYLYPLAEKWNLSIRGGASLATNSTSSITTDDLILNGSLTAVKLGGSKEKPSRLMFGLGYSTFSGEPRILPVVSYSKKVNEKFSYGIGFPNTYAQLNANDRSSFKTLIWLNGFYANLNESIVEAEKASFTTVSTGLEYNYLMDDIWSLTFKGGYSIYNKYELLDADSNTSYDFDLGPKPYFSAGVKFSLKNKIKKR